MELLQMLTSQLGVTDSQAQGGAGLLFKLAKENLSSDDFEKVASAVPEIDSLLSSAPESGGMSGLLGGLASSFGGSSQLGNLASLAGGFKKLDMDSGLVAQFIPIVLSYVQSQGGDAVRDLLAKALK
jgi:hypothetical protein